MIFHLETPVVLLCFNRPRETALVMERIREARPPRLYVIADASRTAYPKDVSLCAEVRKIATAVDWPCELITDFAEDNMGCFLRVSSGLNSAFGSDDELIILEDDCVPHPTFFRFCQELLTRYRNDNRIFAISGDNFQIGPPRMPYSYYFSQIFHCWGWATWRSQWQSVDLPMSLWPDVRDGNWLDDAVPTSDAVPYFRPAFERTYSGQNSSWAYRVSLSSLIQNKVNILPSVNLVENIGFGVDATHTKNVCAGATPEAAIMTFPLVHPPHMIVDRRADRATFSKLGGGSQNLLKRLAKHALRRINATGRRTRA